MGLTPEQVAAYQRDTEELLEDTGCRVQHAGLRALAARAGGRVDEAQQRVRLPRGLTRQLLALAPSHYRIDGLTGRSWTVGGQMRQALAIVTDPWIVDWPTRRLRHPRLDDVVRHTRIAQQLDEVGAISLMDYPVTDYPGAASSLRAMEAHILAHDKHMVVLATAPDRLERWIRLVGALRATGGATGARPLSAGVAVLSPLTLSAENGQLLELACAHDMPVIPTVCPMSGTTAPYTRSGVLLQANAEVVFLAALTQMLRPGHPFLYISGPSRTDMRDGEDLYYTLDKVQWKIAAAQLGRAYGLPTGAECGGSATSTYGLQSGAEGVLFMQAAWDSGAHWLSGLGSCGNAVCMSAEMMLVQLAWLRAAQFLGRGLPAPTAADRGSLAARGPGSHFLDDDLTLANLRSDEFFADPLFDAGGRPEGTIPLLERAHQHAERLAEGAPSPWPSSQQDTIRSFFAAEYRQAEAAAGR
jgi:trimethylamine---corrinoid protein Co-methyltransferase